MTGLTLYVENIDGVIFFFVQMRQNKFRLIMIIKTEEPFSLSLVGCVLNMLKFITISSSMSKLSFFEASIICSLLAIQSLFRYFSNINVDDLNRISMNLTFGVSGCPGTEESWQMTMKSLITSPFVQL